jgi:hypothetical protein
MFYNNSEDRVLVQAVRHWPYNEGQIVSADQYKSAVCGENRPWDTFLSTPVSPCLRRFTVLHTHQFNWHPRHITLETENVFT